MKRYMILISVGLAICVGFSLAQVGKPYKTKPVPSGSECLFTGRTYDEVWEAAANVLMTMKFTVTVAQKESGMMTAAKGPTTAGIIAFGWLAKSRNINLLLKKQEDGIVVRANLKVKKGLVPLFEEMGKLLYAK